ncbi:hypothetical protein HAX54_035863 [Datura stramonium]|uniref:Uncharacterized protein n=1 Tax=Datura stramonium TaxID=4076 RepID=A0ABS8VJ75_DATST|nr:hypothetical protein [Datura stramonium]
METAGDRRSSVWLFPDQQWPKRMTKAVTQKKEGERRAITGDGKERRGGKERCGRFWGCLAEEIVREEREAAG